MLISFTLTNLQKHVILKGILMVDMDYLFIASITSALLEITPLTLMTAAPHFNNYKNTHNGRYDVPMELVSIMATEFS